MAFNGDWKVCENDNFEAFLIALGVPEKQRKMVLDDRLEMGIKQEGSKFTIVEKSCLCTKTSEWFLDEEFENILADGSQVKGTFVLSKPNCLTGHFKKLSDGKDFTIIREVDGDTLVQVIKIDGQEAKRTFKKQ
ncbi:fatty acid-binding protein, intestinal-like isoform X2 [Pristis pectinata]|uniref:fatty acid-binding protein, intestinal-like isoform X2 n=1 Tax=Pristis pectinata TaxID=685728 RepID=UPI00223CC124|nr:fatty acid-binding protein, intestinal-like isoform X2 [Pristis pectinata]